MAYRVESRLESLLILPVLWRSGCESCERLRLDTALEAFLSLSYCFLAESSSLEFSPMKLVGTCFNIRHSRPKINARMIADLRNHGTTGIILLLNETFSTPHSHDLPPRSYPSTTRTTPSHRLSKREAAGGRE